VALNAPRGMFYSRASARDEREGSVEWDVEREKAAAMERPVLSDESMTGS